MAAPTFVQASAGNVITATSGTIGSLASVTIGNIIILQVLLDGTSGSMSLDDTNSTIEALDGTDNTMTLIKDPSDIDAWAVGAGEASQWLWIGRAIATTVSADVSNVSGNDMFGRIYEFSGVHTGTAITDVIEGKAVSNGNSTSITDAGVTTTGADRLCCQFVVMNDDNLLNAFSGESGGDWVEAVAEFASATGTDGAIQLQTATLASAGTINGGVVTVVTDPWGVAGFALIPASTTPQTSEPPHLFTDRRRVSRRGVIYR